jgi:hypothetical protein
MLQASKSGTDKRIANPLIFFVTEQGRGTPKYYTTPPTKSQEKNALNIAQISVSHFVHFNKKYFFSKNA